ncbi:hypothetical protein PPL_04068 [Heterostelium album PN500]|uniref:Ubiquitin-like domain-containing protein n=1 Tax=Heterostelium pallidum (strain ATCC 26659 / Pp 5 / PN500) TaxID=670386 RepID=D3B5Y0_HETP5|nr:hypothetical protein PPL_04068 [Heterostelium album PN500]EFA83278.1 hypothetical protein PPL_04068 [Heterostelium album PN500]|eukprot:XP_020435395.1 hypothetical protein PPL_04068 [Heterostelium album PN500]
MLVVAERFFIHCDTHLQLLMRLEQTIFLSAEPSDTIQRLKEKVAIINKLTDKQVTDYIRFVFQGGPLEDKKTIQQYNIPNDSIIFMVYKQNDGSYEDIAPSLLQLK